MNVPRLAVWSVSGPAPTRCHRCPLRVGLRSTMAAARCADTPPMPPRPAAQPLCGSVLAVGVGTVDCPAPPAQIRTGKITPPPLSWVRCVELIPRPRRTGSGGRQPSFDPWSPLNPSQEEDQSQERRLVWEDPHDAGAAFEVLVDAQRAREDWGCAGASGGSSERPGRIGSTGPGPFRRGMPTSGPPPRKESMAGGGGDS